MSHQKRHVSVKETHNHKNRHRRSWNTLHHSREQFKYDESRSRSRKQPSLGTRSSDLIHRKLRHQRHHGKNKKRRSKYELEEVDSAVLQQIDALREKLTELQRSVGKTQQWRSSQESLHIRKNCFSSLFCRGKSKLDQNSKLSFDISQEGSICSSDEECNKKRKRSKRKDRQHRITNNNTIVLPEAYATSAQTSGEFLMNTITQKLESQNNEIQEIKANLKLCVDLLKSTDPNRNNNFPNLLDEYIQMNRVMPLKVLDRVFNKSNQPRSSRKQLEELPIEELYKRDNPFILNVSEINSSSHQRVQIEHVRSDSDSDVKPDRNALLKFLQLIFCMGK